MDRLRELMARFEPPELPALSEELCRDLPVDLPAELTITQAAAVTGLSAHTLRYYERLGLVEVGRDVTGHRVYDHESLGRVLFLSRLRDSDMPIQQIREYVALMGEGERSRPQRLALMQTHRSHVIHRLHELQAALAVIDYKITAYGGHAGELAGEDEADGPHSRQWTDPAADMTEPVR